MDSVREKLAEYAHAAWSGWMVYLFSKCAINEDGSLTIPAPYASRWLRQARTPYLELPANERESDRAEADKMLGVVAAPGELDYAAHH